MSERDNSTDAVTMTRSDAVAIVCMNRPRRLNVLNTELLGCLNEALVAAAGDRSIRAVVLKGAGRSFSAGGDLAEFRADFGKAPKTAEDMVERFHVCIRMIRDMEKPVIAALQGSIAGGGFSLAIACDLSIASQDATFVSAYTRLGTNPDGGGSWTLTRLLGARRALGLMLLNDTIDANKALELGLVNQVVAADLLEPTVLDLARRLAEGPAQAFAAVKRLVHAADTSTLDQQLDQEKAGFVAATRTADFREGITAFFERRSARFN
jgi:2-(1,2-epoxy-1,2-dihydrophenyl)acetyl-CoA isomerase